MNKDEELSYRDSLAWAEIDLKAIESNVTRIEDFIATETEIMAVVKANAYGHGAEAVARAALRGGATRLAVHRVSKGIELRQTGIEAPILLLGYLPPAAAKRVASHDLTPTLTTKDGASALAKAARELGKKVKFHVKVDTGLGRFGLLPDEVVEFFKYVDQLDNLTLEGFYTHFATADEIDKSYTYYQFWLYKRILDQLENEGFSVPIKHVANSAATLDLPETHLDMVRTGIAIYGLYPSQAVSRSVSLTSTLTLKSQVARVRTLPAGSSISYGRTFITKEPTTVALIPIGYGDGYPRIISNRGEVLIHGRRVPILGTICMDQFVVDISSLPDDVKEGEEVVVIGKQGDEEITPKEVADWAETINYEIVTQILPRVNRVYTRRGEETA
ncbi:alanine racemase [Candidatus Bipolaricaulota bacterium]|nr:alanine racemase [Candidatus Bipolaricaulota bacterium]